LSVSGDGLKDVILYSLTDGIAVDRPCRCPRLRLCHEEKENCLAGAMKKVIHIKDLINDFGRNSMITAFSRDWNLQW
jgi:hypothetical protein